MLYIKIPNNFEYDQINYDFDALTTIDPVTQATLCINLQAIVKEVLARWPKIKMDNRLMKAPSIIKHFPEPLKGSITIYYRSLPASESFSPQHKFLRYEPEKNGSEKSKNWTIIRANDSAINDSTTKPSTTSYGIPWCKNLSLTQHMSKETLERAQAKGQEKRANLRHDGDSPAVN